MADVIASLFDRLLMLRRWARALLRTRMDAIVPESSRRLRRELLKWIFGALVLAHGATRAAVPEAAPRRRRARSGRQLWINPAGSNTPPWDTESKGAPDFTTLATAVAAGDEIILSDVLHSFPNPQQLFPGNALLAAGDVVYVRSKSRDASLCTVAASGTAARLLDLQFGSGPPDGAGLAIQFEGIRFENKVASGNKRGQLVKCINDVSALTFTGCRFSFALLGYDGLSGSRQCIDFTDVAEARTILFDDCDFDDIVVTNTSVIQAESTTFLHLRDCRIATVSSTWSTDELSGAFAFVGGGGLVENIRVSGPYSVKATGAAQVVRGGVFCNKSAQPITIDGGDIAGITIDLSSVTNATATGVFFYAAGNTADVIRNCRFHGNRRIGMNTIAGGLLCVKEDGHRATMEDCEAFNNAGFFGALAYSTTGGAFDIRRCRAWHNAGGRAPGGPINGLGIYVGGGAHDCTLDSIVVYDHDSTGAPGPGLLLRNTNTDHPAPRTITLRHVTVFGNRSTHARTGGAVHLQNESVGAALTVNAVNCVFDNPDSTREISITARGAIVNLALTNCFTPNGAAVDVMPPNGTFRNVAPLTGVSLLDDVGRPAAESQLRDAGANLFGAVPTDAEATPWNDATSPTVGGLEAA